MENKSSPVEPYRPSRLHQLYGWIDRLPGPYWLTYVAIVVIAGLMNHIVAWNAHVLAPGEISWYYALTAFFVAYYLFAIDFTLRAAEDSLVEVRPILDATEDEYKRTVFEFTHLPARTSAVVFVSATVTGLALALYLFPSAPEMNPAFPALVLPVSSLSVSMTWLGVYVAVRAFRLLNRVFGHLRAVDIYNQDSIYAMSRYSAWLLILGAIPTYLVFLLAPSLIEITDHYFLFLIAIAFALLLAILWVPLRSVNRELVLEKRRLLAEVNLRIKAMYALMHERIDRQEFEGVAELRETIEGLLREREFIQSLRTWPWRPRTLTGLLSTVVLPVLAALIIEIASRFIPF